MADDPAGRAARSLKVMASDPASLTTARGALAYGQLLGRLTADAA